MSVANFGELILNYIERSVQEACGVQVERKAGKHTDNTS